MNTPTTTPTTRITTHPETTNRCRDVGGRYGYALTCAYLDARRAGFVHTAAAFASLIRNHPERTRA